MIFKEMHVEKRERERVKNKEKVKKIERLRKKT